MMLTRWRSRSNKERQNHQLFQNRLATTDQNVFEYIRHETEVILDTLFK